MGFSLKIMAGHSPFEFCVKGCGEQNGGCVSVDLSICMRLRDKERLPYSSVVESCGETVRPKPLEVSRAEGAM